mmetsp:Transcript_15496/g.17562  ORF Transcript_15496/g.17562 Transcript_15496/m.17562 type:complete len:317 (+) Transcript_15496:380-1330(+)
MVTSKATASTLWDPRPEETIVTTSMRSSNKFDSTPEEAINSMYSSTTRSLEVLKQAQGIGKIANRSLEEQGEKVDRVTSKLKSVEVDLATSSKYLDNLRSTFGFTGSAKKYKHAFESKHGAPAEWSGPLKCSSGVLKKVREHFFALLGKTLYVYQDSAHIAKEMGRISLANAEVKTYLKKLKFSILVIEPKRKTYMFRCQSRNDFFGWLSVIIPRCKEHTDTSKTAESFYEARALHSETVTCEEDAAHNLITEEKGVKIQNNVQEIATILDMLKDLADNINNGISEQNNKISSLEHASVATFATETQVKAKEKGLL